MNFFWILFFFGFFLRYKKSKISRIVIIISTLWLLVTSTKFIPDLLVYGLEKQYSTIKENSSNLGLPILVLGGGSVYDPDLTPQDRLSPNSLARLNEGIRLYHSLGQPRMIFSGYSSKNGVTQAAITRDAAICLGIPKDKISILDQPSTTEEEALAYKKKYGHTDSAFILVTSDIHMPRAMYLFRKAGLNPKAAPTDTILRCGDDFHSYWWVSHKNNFDKFAAALHEYIGLLWANMH